MRQKLEQYPYIVARIKRLQKEIRQLQSQTIHAGAVMASQHDIPFAQREVVISGLSKGTVGVIQKKQVELEQAICDKAEIERYIDGVEDLRMQEIITRRIVYSETWQEVAASFGYKETADSVKQAYSRHFR